MKSKLLILSLLVSAFAFGQGSHGKSESVKDSSGKFATTLYVDRAVSAGGGGGGLPALKAGRFFLGAADSTTKDTALVSDFNIMPEIKKYFYAIGLQSSHNTTNHTPQTVDEMQALFNTSATGSASVDFGGWLATGTSGDSIQLTAPIGVLIGNSIVEGHPGLHGRLHPYPGVAGFISNYPDSTGQLSYQLRGLTNMRWYNQGIGGQTSTQVRQRFLRDAIGIASNPNDTRGSVSTLPRSPQIIIIECGINDFAAGTAVSVVEANIIFMVATAQEYGIPTVVFNSPGDQVSTQAMLIKISQFNKWLASGALNIYGTTVYDFNKWWNGPSSTCNCQGNGMLADDIHPTKAGYDSLAIDLFNAVKLPVLNKAIFINEIAGGFSGYSRPANITINAIGGYTIAKSTDTLAITSYVGDSVWVKVASSTNVSGTTFTGFSSILWGLSNNQGNNIIYSRRPVSYGPQNTDATFSSIIITSPDYTARNAILIQDPTGGVGFQVQSGATTRLFMLSGAGVNNVFNSTSDLNITGNIGINGTIKTTGQTILGNLQVGNAATAGTTGYGIGQFGGGVFIETSAFILNRIWGAQNLAISSSTTFFNITDGAGNYTTVNNSVHSSLIVNPVLNNTATDHFGSFIAVNIAPNITSQIGVRVIGATSTVGDNLFNTTSGRTFIGTDDIVNGYSAALGVNKIYQGFLPPRMTTAQRDSIGYISSVTISGGSWTVPPAISFSGGTGSGLLATCYIAAGTSLAVYVSNHGIGYKTSSAVTGSFTGGTGSGGVITVNQVGPENGLQVFCTDCTATDASTGVLQTWSSSASAWKNSW